MCRGTPVCILERFSSSKRLGRAGRCCSMTRNAPEEVQDHPGGNIQIVSVDNRLLRCDVVSLAWLFQQCFFSRRNCTLYLRHTIQFPDPQQTRFCPPSNWLHRLRGSFHWAIAPFKRCCTLVHCPDSRSCQQAHIVAHGALKLGGTLTMSIQCEARSTFPRTASRVHVSLADSPLVSIPMNLAVRVQALGIRSV